MMGADSFLPSELLKLKWKAGRRFGVVVLCCSIGRTGSMANVRAESLGIACGAFCVIACTMSFLVSCSGLVRCNVEGASACACAAALEMTRSDVVANVKQIGPRTEARYAGNRGGRQAFFFLIFKNRRTEAGIVKIESSLTPRWNRHS